MEQTTRDTLRVASAPVSASSGAILDCSGGLDNPSTIERLNRVQRLSDEQLTAHLQQLNHRKHRLDAELLLYIAELDRRKLYREAACASLFEYLTSRLGFSEDVAYKRMWAARTLRDFSSVYELLSEGRIHLSALLLIRPHLTQENHGDWLTAVAGKSKREVEKLVAARCPKPDVPARIRRLPASTSNQPSLCAAAAVVDRSHCATAPAAITNDTNATIPEPRAPDSSPSVTSLQPEPHAAPERSATSPLTVSRHPKIQPLSASNYRVVFTASERLKRKLDRASQLASHAIASSDLPGLLERALDAFIDREERRRFGATHPRRTQHPPKPPTMHGRKADGREVPSSERPQRATDDRAITRRQATDALSGSSQNIVALGTSDDQSRYISAGIRRRVWERDAEQCTYVNDQGERCQCRHYLQFDHRIARALGGPSTVENLRIRCASHNALAAEQVLGSTQVAKVMAWAKQKRQHSKEREVPEVHENSGE